MGISYRFICNNCNYDVHSSGKLDFGMKAVTDPHICLDCNEVIDTLVGYCGELFIPDVSTEEEFTEDEIDELYRCDQCKGNNIKKWSKYNRRCPKCNDRMRIDKIADEVLWD
jgi:ssDNA-binding Zn-finger/Zn-ribbon topoisomerase 1